MTAVRREIPVEVVTRTTVEVTVACDGPDCTQQWLVPKYPQSVPWLTLSRYTDPLWDNGTKPDREIKHFCDIPCLRAWAASVTYLWESGAVGKNES